MRVSELERKGLQGVYGGSSSTVFVYIKPGDNPRFYASTTAPPTAHPHDKLSKLVGPLDLDTGEFGSQPQAQGRPEGRSVGSMILPLLLDVVKFCLMAATAGLFLIIYICGGRPGGHGGSPRDGH